MGGAAPFSTAIDGIQPDEAVARGKHVWERNSCINCYTILGEGGAYLAPELGTSGRATEAATTPRVPVPP